MISWLPLSHDFGLIWFLIMPMAAGFAQFHVTQPGQDVSQGTVQSGDHCDIKLDGDRTVRVAAVTIPPPPPGPH